MEKKKKLDNFESKTRWKQKGEIELSVTKKIRGTRNKFSHKRKRAKAGRQNVKEK